MNCTRCGIKRSLAVGRHIRDLASKKLQHNPSLVIIMVCDRRGGVYRTVTLVLNRVGDNCGFHDIAASSMHWRFQLTWPRGQDLTSAYIQQCEASLIHMIFEYLYTTSSK